jgi:hypothetical protein
VLCVNWTNAQILEEVWMMDLLPRSNEKRVTFMWHVRAGCMEGKDEANDEANVPMKKPIKKLSSYTFIAYNDI